MQESPPSIPGPESQIPDPASYVRMSLELARAGNEAANLLARIEDGETTPSGRWNEIQQDLNHALLAFEEVTGIEPGELRREVAGD